MSTLIQAQGVVTLQPRAQIVNSTATTGGSIKVDAFTSGDNILSSNIRIII